MYTPKFTPAAIENIKRLPKNVKAGLKAGIMNDLVADPERSSKTLTGVLSEFRSFHWRDYRVVFKLDDGRKALAIVAVAKKTRNPDRNLYRRLETAVKNGELAAKVLETLKGFR